jgi:hypothetical protein
MDPNEALKTIRRAIKRAEGGREGDLYITVELPYLREAAEAMAALDEWLTRGGFPPDSWKPSSYDSNPSR